MHPIITAALVDQFHADLLRRAERERRLRELPQRRPTERRWARVPAAVLLLRGWLVRG